MCVGPAVPCGCPQDRPVLLHHLFVLIVATGVLRAANYPTEALRTTLDDLSRLAMVGEEASASYLSTARKVTNWRKEAARHLDPDVVAAAAAFLEAERPVVSRCVKLNNYWCIKSARWDGEMNYGGLRGEDSMTAEIERLLPEPV